jgi:hypothetical protein
LDFIFSINGNEPQITEPQIVVESQVTEPQVIVESQITEPQTMAEPEENTVD